MSPVTKHFKKNNKRKLEGPTDLLLKAQIYQNDPGDIQGPQQQQQQQHSDGGASISDIIMNVNNDNNDMREAWMPDTTNQEHWLLNKRQESLLPSPTILPTLTIDPSPTPTQTKVSKGEQPLSNVVVQLILGGLATIVIIAVLVRCIHINRQQRILLETRRDNLREAQAQLVLHHSAHRGTGAGGTHITHITTDAAGRRVMSTTTTTTMVTPLGIHLVPTNSTTLAARLRMYQSQSQSWRDPYPYGQQPLPGGVMDTARESTTSFVAPSYEQDVSPPPFMISSSAGKPPAYAEVFTATVPPIVVTPLETLPQRQQQGPRRSSPSPSPAPVPERPTDAPEP